MVTDNGTVSLDGMRKLFVRSYKAFTLSGISASAESAEDVFKKKRRETLYFSLIDKFFCGITSNEWLLQFKHFFADCTFVLKQVLIVLQKLGYLMGWRGIGCFAGKTGRKAIIALAGC